MSTMLNTLWVEGSLSYIEQVCLASALSVGHQVCLYTYENVANIPNGVQVRDAREILPRQKVIQYRKNSSYALGANIFRYELMRLGKGIWIDTDVYFMKPIQYEDILFGWEDGRYINNAILHFPSDSEILKLLQGFIDSDPVIAPWWSEEEQKEQQKLYLSGQHKPLESLPWATTGPKAITYFAKLLSLDRFAKPSQIFYPVHWKDAKRLFDPDFSCTNTISEDTLTVHLWNHLIEALKKNPPPAGSFIYNICKKHNILIG